MLHQLAHWLGLDTGSGPVYLFWSGFGSDLAEVTLITGLLTAYHHRNCHVRRCFRLGQPVQGTHYLACPKHHPEHPGKRRGVRVENIIAAWEKHHTKGTSE